MENRLHVYHFDGPLLRLVVQLAISGQKYCVSDSFCPD